MSRGPLRAGLAKRARHLQCPQRSENRSKSLRRRESPFFRHPSRSRQNPVTAKSFPSSSALDADPRLQAQRSGRSACGGRSSEERHTSSRGRNRRRIVAARATYPARTNERAEKRGPFQILTAERRG